MPHPPLLEIHSRSFRDKFYDLRLSEYTTGKTITYGEFSKSEHNTYHLTAVGIFHFHTH